MKSFWKQCVEWAIRSKDRFFYWISVSPRARILFLYWIFGLVIFFVVSVIVDVQIAQLTERIVGSRNLDPLVSEEISSELIEAIGEVSLLVRFIILIMLVVISYFLSSITLRPVQRSLEERKRFIANISHELRTPLSIMKTNFEAALLQGDSLTKKELVEMIESNLEEVDRTAKIIQFLLNFSELESRLASLQLVQVNLGNVARKAIRLVEEDAERGGVRLVYNDDDMAVVRGNATALEELVLNLLKNAIRFTPRGGAVRLQIGEYDHGTIVLSVADTGEGIRPVDLPHIFEPFYAGSNVIKKRKESAGLGLAIVQAIARLHRAKIKVESQVGNGTQIAVRFPAYRRI